MSKTQEKLHAAALERIATLEARVRELEAERDAAFQWGDDLDDLVSYSSDCFHDSTLWESDYAGDEELSAKWRELRNRKPMRSTR